MRSSTEGTLAEALDGRHAVRLEEVVLAQAFRFEALLNVLERQSVIEKAEILEEIKRLQANTPKATYSKEGRRNGWSPSTGRCPQ